MVEWARLESECAGNGTEGSNPSLSAIIFQEVMRRVWISGSILIFAVGCYLIPCRRMVSTFMGGRPDIETESFYQYFSHGDWVSFLAALVLFAPAALTFVSRAQSGRMAVVYSLMFLLWIVLSAGVGFLFEFTFFSRVVGTTVIYWGVWLLIGVTPAFFFYRVVEFLWGRQRREESVTVSG